MLLSSIFRKSAGPPDPTDDFWFSPLGWPSKAGPVVSAETAMRLSTVFACVRILAETAASLPLILYERLERGKQRAPDHPLYDVLHDQPNPWQTSFEWVEMMQAHVALRGNAYSEIVPGPRRGAVEQLVPFHPDRVQPMRLDNGGVRYQVDGGQRTLEAFQMFHLRGLSTDGLEGLSPIDQAAREPVGIALAAEDYVSRFYANDAQPRGIIEWEGSFKNDDADKWKQSWQKAQTGARRHSVAVLEKGMKYHEVGMTNRAAQFIEARKFQKEDIAQIFRVPLHLLQALDRATFNNVEQLDLDFVTHTMRPWFRRWEQAIGMRLIVEDNDRFFAEFLVDALLRGDTAARYEAYSKAITDGWMTRNEAREKENLNPLDGLDEPLQQMNMGSGSGADEESRAARLVRMEVDALRRAYAHKRRGQFLAWLRTYYDDFVETVSKALGVSADVAKRYTDSSYAEITGAEDVAALLNAWEITRPGELQALLSSLS